DAYPDITLLPALANLFKTSIDALVGMDRINGASARAALFQAAHAHLQAGRHSEAAALLEEALATFPNDEALMSELALALAFDGGAEPLRRAAALCERALAGNPSEGVRHTTRAAICFIYFKLGEGDRALAAARKLPHMRESREVILAQLERGMTPPEIDACLRVIALGEGM
ncbi:MAG: tetratricopeptide repeat protein, partial [Clostridiales bacterium]|nr:tetratricopeptide repeat protein [Clostridiales bacterium]